MPDDVDLHLHFGGDAAGLQRRATDRLAHRHLARLGDLPERDVLGAIITPKFSVRREYIVVFALAPLILLVFAVRKEVTTVEAVILSSCSSCGSCSSRSRRAGGINLGLAIVAICGIIIGAATVSEGTDQILNRYSIEGTVFGATVVTAVLTIEDLFLTVRPIRLGMPELGIVVLAGGSVAIGLERPALAPPGTLRPDRCRRGLHVDPEPQTLARLRATRSVHRLLGRQLRGLRRRPRR